MANEHYKPQLRREITERQIDEMRGTPYNRQSGGSAQFGQIGIPSLQWNTAPVYSTLPPNAVHLNFTQESTVSGATVTLGEIFRRTVPIGRIIYIREIRVNVIDAVSVTSSGTTALDIPDATFSITVNRNGGPDPFNQNIILEPLDNFHPLFLWASENDTVTINVAYDYSFLSIPPTEVTFLVHLHGDVLVPRGNLPPAYTAYSGYK